MNDIVIKARNDTFFRPGVNFNVKTGVCEISGKSLLEETYNFYMPLIDWLKEYCEDVTHPVTLNFKLTYYNTSSSKLIIQMINVVKEHFDNGGEVRVNWFFEPEEEDLIEDVQDICDATNIEINFIHTDEELG